MADLITLSDYKTAKGIASTNEDAKITPLLATVSAFIRNYCGREFTTYYATNKTEYFSILWGEYFVTLSEFPLVELVSVSERENLTADYTVNTSIYEDDGSVYKIASNGIDYESFKPGSGSVKVVYKAGYASIPEDLKQSAIDLVSYYLNQEYKVNRAIGSSVMQNAPQATASFSAELPAHIKRVLDLYRVI